MAENIMFNIGIGIDNEVDQDLAEVTKQIQEVLKTDLKFNIDASNIEELQQQLANLGGELKITRDSVTGLATGFTATATAMNGQLVQVSGSFDNLQTGADKYVAKLNSMRDQISGQTSEQKAITQIQQEYISLL
jgi:uncharacterized protein involved in exopolysaccharide biosynthesis